MAVSSYLAGLADRTLTVGVPPADVYQAVSDVKRMARWSPECFAALVWSRRDGAPARFVGLNRRGPWVWFTTCQVVTARPGEEFAFEVTTFGMPVSRWSYRLAPAGGGTEVTEAWLDKRGRGAQPPRAGVHRQGRQGAAAGQPRGHADHPLPPQAGTRSDLSQGRESR